MRDTKLDLSTGAVDLQFVTPTVMAYGLSKGLISEGDVIEVALARYNSRLVQNESEERIALLLSDEAEQLRQCLPSIRDDDELDEEEPDEAIRLAQRVWIYLTLRAIREHWNDYDDPWVEIEEWLDELRAPDAYKRFIYYEPAQTGRPSGLNGMLIDLDRYLDRESTALGSHEIREKR